MWVVGSAAQECSQGASDRQAAPHYPIGGFGCNCPLKPALAALHRAEELMQPC